MHTTPDEVFWLVGGGFVAGFATASIIAVYFMVALLRELKKR
jgi:hypothetical protein